MNKPNLYDVLDRFYDALRKRSPSKLETFFTDEALYVDPDLKIADLMVRTKEAIARTLVAHMSEYSRFKIEIKKVSVKDNEATVNWTLEGLFRPQDFSEKKFSGIDTFSFDKNGKIYHLSSMWNASEHSYGTIRAVYREK